MLKKFFFVTALLIAIVTNAHSQYTFTDDIKIPVTGVKNQQATGTCWSFATVSFLESEIIRLKGIHVDLSEMYLARMAYLDKAQNYILRQGTSNFGEGGLSHDVLRIMKLHGLLPESAYPGLTGGDTVFDHAELSSGLKGYLDAVIKSGRPGNHWRNAVNGILDAYLGPVPKDFAYEGQTLHSMSFADQMDIESDEYRSITSFSHHPFYEDFILEIPDNYMNGSYYNVKLDEMVGIIDYAIEHGYSVLWDGDVGEKGFSQKKGMALLPANPEDSNLFVKPVDEIVVTQESRQAAFMSYRTTEDHLMHLVGRAKDQDGAIYYIIKNSWGYRGPYEGFLYMSANYLKMKTVSITLHKDGIPKGLK